MDETLDDLCECSICNCLFKNPKSLPCLHTFCLKCIENYCKSLNYANCKCPMCKSYFTIKNKDCNYLKSNFYIAKLCEAKLKQNKTGETETCASHNNDLILLCQTCNIPICTTCLPDHKSHHIQGIKEVREEMLGEILKIKNKLSTKAMEFKHDISEQKSNLENSLKIVTQLIHKQGEILKTIIDRKMNNLIVQAQECFDSKMSKLNNAEKINCEIEDNISLDPSKLLIRDLLILSQKFKKLNQSEIDRLVNLYKEIKISDLKFEIDETSDNVELVNGLTLGKIQELQEVYDISRLKEITLNFNTSDNCTISTDGNLYALDIDNLILNIYKINKEDVVYLKEVTLSHPKYQISYGIKSNIRSNGAQILANGEELLLNLRYNERHELSAIFKYRPSLDELVLWNVLPECCISTIDARTVLVATHKQLIEILEDKTEKKTIDIPYRDSYLPTYKLKDGRYLLASKGDGSYKILLLDDAGKSSKTYVVEGSKIAYATDGKKFIFVLECGKECLVVLTMDLEIYRELSIPSSKHISFDEDNERIILMGNDNQTVYLLGKYC